MKLLYRYTKDGLNLLGGYWESRKKKECCVVFIHGMYDNLIENIFANALGEELSEKGYGFIFGHNRGHGVINSTIEKNPITQKTELKIIGSTYEKFEESTYDVELWLKEAREQGYSKIILAGHSLGCLKNLYYVSKNGMEGIDGMIFVSAPDAVGLINRSEEHKYMIEEAREYLKNKEPKKVLEKRFLDIFPVSARTFYNFRKGSCMDIFPLVENPEDFGYFKEIDKPILMVIGGKDNIIVDTPENDLKVLKSRAEKCSDFTGKIIDNATHRFVRKEKELSEAVSQWLMDKFKF